MQFFQPDAGDFCWAKNFQIGERLCECVYVWEREREREREIGNKWRFNHIRRRRSILPQVWKRKEKWKKGRQTKRKREKEIKGKILKEKEKDRDK